MFAGDWTPDLMPSQATVGHMISTESNGPRLEGKNVNYREVNKSLSVVARNFFLLLLNCSARPCLGPV